MSNDALWVDLGPQDVNGNPDTAALARAGYPWSGLILKASEGLYYDSEANGNHWLSRTLKAFLGALAAGRIGVDAFWSLYHFLNVGQSGRAQAEFFAKVVESIGGWGPGAMWPIVDVENSQYQPHDASAAQISDCMAAFSERILQITGRAPMRYTGSWIRDKGVKNKLGYPFLWVPAWSKTLPPRLYVDQGYTLADTVGWQGVGDGNGEWALAKTAPVGPGGSQWGVDITAVIINGGADAKACLDYIRTHSGQYATPG